MTHVDACSLCAVLAVEEFGVNRVVDKTAGPHAFSRLPVAIDDQETKMQ
jgi:hypothetical protein